MSDLFPSVKNDPSYERTVAVMEATRILIDAMEDGEQTTYRKLAAKVAERLNLASTTAFQLVQIALKSFDDVTVKQGRFGGVFKGLKEKKIDDRKRCGECNQVIRRKKQERNILSSSPEVKSADETLPMNCIDSEDDDMDCDEEWSEED